jgi:hypothetical protein
LPARNPIKLIPDGILYQHATIRCLAPEDPARSAYDVEALILKAMAKDPKTAQHMHLSPRLWRKTPGKQESRRHIPSNSQPISNQSLLVVRWGCSVYWPLELLP